MRPHQTLHGNWITQICNSKICKIRLLRAALKNRGGRRAGRSFTGCLLPKRSVWMLQCISTPLQTLYQMDTFDKSIPANPASFSPLQNTLVLIGLVLILALSCLVVLWFALFSVFTPLSFVVLPSCFFFLKAHGP